MAWRVFWIHDNNHLNQFGADLPSLVKRLQDAIDRKRDHHQNHTGLMGGRRVRPSIHTRRAAEKTNTRERRTTENHRDDDAKNPPPQDKQIAVSEIECECRSSKHQKTNGDKVATAIERPCLLRFSFQSIPHYMRKCPQQDLRALFFRQNSAVTFPADHGS